MKNIYLLILLSVFIINANAQPLGWSYSNAISVTENSGATVANYQLMVTFDSQSLITAGQMNADCSDLRFGTYCDSINLNYWIESGINTTTTIVWIKIDTLFASQTSTIYMFYGNIGATTTSSVSGTFNGAHSATDSVASGGAGGATNSQRGFRFAPNVDILVTDFGKREPNGTIRYVTLFDFATQAIVQQTQVGGPAAQYSYTSLSNPIWLTAGTQYVLELYQGASDGYYFGTSSQIGQHLTYLDMRYCNSCTQNTFPTNTLTNYHYGYPDLWYYTKTNVTPAPTYTIGGGFTLNLGPDDSFCVSTILDAANVGSTYSWNTTDTTQTINVDTSGLYICTVVNNQNCSATDSVQIVINPTPVVNLGPDSSYCTGTTLDAGAGFSYVWTDNSTNQTLVVSATGTYDVAITDANSCVGVDTINITVYGLPIVVGTATPNSVCASDTVNFSAVGAVSYIWDNGILNGNNLMLTGGDFIVMGTDSNDCSNADTVNVIVNSLPTVTFGFSTDSVCTSYGPVILSGGSPAGGTYSGTGVSAGSFDPSIGIGNYSLVYTYTDANGCTNSDTHNLLVSGCAGMEENGQNNFRVFPNPSNGFLNIVFDEWNSNTVVLAYDMLGKLVYSNRLPSNYSTVQMNLAPGTYRLVVSNGVQSMHQSIIIQ